MATGKLTVRAYRSRAIIPLQGVTIAVTDQDGRLLAIRQTDRSGLTAPIEITVPARAESLDPDFGGQPFTAVTLSARHPDYVEIDMRNVQVFADAVSYTHLRAHET